MKAGYQSVEEYEAAIRDAGFASIEEYEAAMRGEAIGEAPAPTEERGDRR